MWFSLLLVSGCGESSEFEKEKRALTAYQNFEEARAGKDWERAEKAILEAIDWMPDSRNLRTWQVYLQYEKGAYQQCSQLGESYMVQFPGSGQLRYTLAACLAEQGLYLEASKHLHLLVADGRYHPIEIGEDKSFKPMLSLPAFTDVVRAPELNVGIVDAPKSVIVGQESSLRVQVRFRSTEKLKLEAVPIVGLEIVKISEQYSDLDDHMSMCQIDFQLRALVEGNIELRHWRITAGEQATEIEPYSFEAIALGQIKSTASLSPIPQLPSELLLLERLPFVQSGQSGQLIVAGPPNAQFSHNAASAIELELWRDKKRQAKGYLLKKSEQTVEVRIQYDNQILINGEY